MPLPNLPEQRYEAERNVLHVWHPAPVRLESQAQIKAYFDAIVRYWRGACAGRKAYYLVDWTNFSTDIRENSFYAEQVRRVVEECAVVIVRFTNDPQQRTAGRLAAIKLHRPSNVYATRAEAEAVLEGLRSGTVQLG